MPELRVILLVAGVLFVAGSRGSNGGARGAIGRMASRRRATTPGEPVAPRRPAPLPEINMLREPRCAVPDTLPVIELASSAGNPDAARTRHRRFRDEVAVDASHESTSTQSILRAHDEPVHRSGRLTVSEVRAFSYEDAGCAGRSSSLAWPSETERRIVTLRVLPRGEPRFPGRALRQAFASAGFWHGPLDIYHLPDDAGRVILSAPRRWRSPARSIRRSWIRSVSPASTCSRCCRVRCPEREAFDELVHAARQLAERLDGTITDQHGEELTLAAHRASAPIARGAGTARAAGES